MSPVVLSTDDLTHLLWVASGNPCRDEQAQAALLDAARHIDNELVSWSEIVASTWARRPCCVGGCERSVPRDGLDSVCGECRDEREREHAIWHARRA